MTYTVDDKMKTLLAAPEAVAVLERFFPKILKNPALQMTAAMTLRQVAGFAQSRSCARSRRPETESVFVPPVCAGGRLLSGHR